MIILNPEDDSKQDEVVGEFRFFVHDMVPTAASVLEIGPSYAPLFRRSLHPNVKTLDHGTGDELRAKYSAMGMDVSAIGEVDFVWRGEPLSRLVGRGTFEYIFASHVIEHSVDLVRFLNDCGEALTETGRLILLVPDKRYCFDLLQPLTDTAKAIADYSRNGSVHSIESLYREEIQVLADCSGEFQIAWNQSKVKSLKLLRSDPKGRMADSISRNKSGEYFDAHEYFFTPSSFLMIMSELRFLGLTSLNVEMLTRSRGCEFLAVLHNDNSPVMKLEQLQRARMELSVNIMREQVEAWEQLAPFHRPIDLSFLNVWNTMQTREAS